MFPIYPILEKLAKLLEMHTFLFFSNFLILYPPFLQPPSTFYSPISFSPLAVQISSSQGQNRGFSCSYEAHVPPDFQRNSVINQFNIKVILSYILCEKNQNWSLIQTELFWDLMLSAKPDMLWNTHTCTHTQSYYYPIHVPPFCYKGTDDHKSLYSPVAHVAAPVRAQSMYMVKGRGCYL